MKRYIILLAVMALTVGLLAAPASAITNPTPDGDDHPQVGQLLFYDPTYQPSRYGENDPGGWFNCTGTLIDSNTVLTAGHCTFGVGTEGEVTNEGALTEGRGGTDIWISFEETSDYSMLSSSFTFASNAKRYESWELALDASDKWIRGTANPHPDYNDNAFYLHDAGIVVLDDNFDVTPAELPSEGYLDQYLNQRRNSQRFTPVGYGLNSGFPWYLGGDTRSNASVMLVDARGVFGLGSFAPDTSVVFSNNNGKAHRGGTCFGDSGGPIFDEGTLTIVAVTSFGVNQTCTGTGAGYRIDQPDDLEFITGFLNQP